MNAPQNPELYDPGLESTGERADLLASSGEEAPRHKSLRFMARAALVKVSRSPTCLTTWRSKAKKYY
jgi:hypothetical protein